MTTIFKQPLRGSDQKLEVFFCYVCVAYLLLCSSLVRFGAQQITWQHIYVSSISLLLAMGTDLLPSQFNSATLPTDYYRDHLENHPIQPQSSVRTPVPLLRLLHALDSINLSDHCKFHLPAFILASLLLFCLTTRRPVSGCAEAFLSVHFWLFDFRCWLEYFRRKIQTLTR